MQGYDRYAYANNAPTRYTDPTGHMIWEGTDGSGPSKATAEYYRQRADAIKCQGGNRLYCSYAENHPVETATFVAAGLAAPGLIEYGVLGGGFGALADTMLGRAGLACIQSTVCRWVTGMAGGAEGYQSVNTPYGPARQSTTQQALQARDQVQNGANLYKTGTLGPSNGVESQFWSLENPLSNPNYANQYGVPPQNLVSGNTFLMVGQLKDTATFVTREAPRFGTNIGGAIEVVVEEYGIMILEFIMP